MKKSKILAALLTLVFVFTSIAPIIPVFAGDEVSPTIVKIDTTSLTKYGRTSDTWETNYPAANVFDGDTGTYYDGQALVSGGYCYAGIDLGEGYERVVTKIRYYPRNHANRTKLAGGKFQGSNDTVNAGYADKTWEDLCTITGTDVQWHELDVSDTKEYRYLRFYGTGGGGNIAEIEFYAVAVAEDLAPTLAEQISTKAVASGTVALPVLGAGDAENYNVTYTVKDGPSSYASISGTDITYTLPAGGDENVTIEVTVTNKDGGKTADTAMEEVAVLLKKELTADQKAQTDLDAINLEASYSQSVILPTIGSEYNSTIEWAVKVGESSVLVNGNTLNLLENVDETITLTATVTNSGQTKTKDFENIILNSFLDVWYKFDVDSVDEKDGTTAVANSGTNSSITDATLMNGAIVLNSAGSGAAGQGMMYLTGGSGTGNNPYLSMPAGVVNSLTADYTISVFSKGTAGNKPWSISNNAGTSSGFMWVTPNSGGKTAFLFATGGNNSGLKTLTGNTGIAADTWGNVTITYSASNTTVTMYVDGVNAGSLNLGAGYQPSTVFDNSTWNFLGKAAWTGDANFAGSIADFRIYSRALADDEISTIAGDVTKFSSSATNADWDKVAKDTIVIANSLGSVTEVSSNLSLPAATNGSTVVWKSSDTDALGHDGKINFSLGAQTQVTLTATITSGEAEAVRKFTFYVKPVTAYLTALTYDVSGGSPGVSVPDFDPGTQSYIVEVPVDDLSALPTITVTGTPYGGSTVDTGGSTLSVDLVSSSGIGTATVIVTDGLTYDVTFKAKKILYFDNTGEQIASGGAVTGTVEAIMETGAIALRAEAEDGYAFTLLDIDNAPAMTNETTSVNGVYTISVSGMAIADVARVTAYFDTQIALFNFAMDINNQEIVTTNLAFRETPSESLDYDYKTVLFTRTATARSFSAVRDLFDGQIPNGDAADIDTNSTIAFTAHDDTVYDVSSLIAYTSKGYSNRGGFELYGGATEGEMTDRLASHGGSGTRTDGRIYRNLPIVSTTKNYKYITFKLIGNATFRLNELKLYGKLVTVAPNLSDNVAMVSGNSVAFPFAVSPLVNTEYTVYDAATGGSEVADITAERDGNNLKLTFTNSNQPAIDTIYCVSAKAAKADMESERVAITVKPESNLSVNANLSSLSYKVGGGGEVAITSFDKNQLTYNVALGNVADGTAIQLTGVAEDAGANIKTNDTVTLADNFATATITVEAEDTSVTKTYTVNFTTTTVETIEFSTNGAVYENGANALAGTVEVTRTGKSLGVFDVTVKPAAENGYEFAMLNLTSSGATTTPISKDYGMTSGKYTFTVNGTGMPVITAYFDENTGLINNELTNLVTTWVVNGKELSEVINNNVLTSNINFKYWTDITRPISSAAGWGGIDDAKDNFVTYDAGEGNKVNITKVIVYGRYGFPDRFSMNIQTSIDGKTFTTITDGYTTSAARNSYTPRAEFTFDTPVNTRYLRFRSAQGSGTTNTGISLIKVYGEYDYVPGVNIQNNVYRENLTKVEETDPAYKDWNVDVVKAYTEGSGKLIVASYDSNNALIDFLDIPKSGDRVAFLSGISGLITDGAKKIKAFIWKDLDSLKPAGAFDSVDVAEE